MKHSPPPRTNLWENEKGLVSMIVSVLIMLILSLIVIAMSRNANREQRQALDRQLSSEAFYSSESGINDVVRYIRTSSTEQAVKTDCAPLPGVTNRLDGSAATSTGGVSYSCILYDQEPPNLVYGNLGIGTSKLIPIESSSPLGLGTLILMWDEEQGNGDVTGCSTYAVTPSPVLPSSAAWPANCSAGMLRYELIRVDQLNRTSLVENNEIRYLMPRSAAGVGANTYGATQSTGQGAIGQGHCNNANTPRKCAYEIRGINLAPGQRMYLKLRNEYKSNLIFIGGTDTAGAPIKFKNAQVVIDSTGKASDILMRLQVRVPVRTEYETEDSAIHTSKGLCKLLEVYPPSYGASDGVCPLN